MQSTMCRFQVGYYKASMGSNVPKAAHRACLPKKEMAACCKFSTSCHFFLMITM
jgi:hypothetical protein